MALSPSSFFLVLLSIQETVGFPSPLFLLRKRRCCVPPIPMPYFRPLLHSDAIFLSKFSLKHGLLYALVSISFVLDSNTLYSFTKISFVSVNLLKLPHIKFYVAPPPPAAYLRPSVPFAPSGVTWSTTARPIAMSTAIPSTPYVARTAPLAPDSSTTSGPSPRKVSPDNFGRT